MFQEFDECPIKLVEHRKEIEQVRVGSDIFKFGTDCVRVDLDLN